MFDRIFKETMKLEGTYSNHPDDRGGETYCGIARKKNPRWEGWSIIDREQENKDFPSCLDSNSFLFNDVKTFYRSKYWDAIQGDKFPAKQQDIIRELFDTAVNIGPKTAIRILQKALNLLNRNGKLFSDLVTDGLIGSKTLKAVFKFCEKDFPQILVLWMNIYQGLRYIEIMENNPSQETFARGWAKRVELHKTPNIESNFLENNEQGLLKENPNAQSNFLD